VGKTYISDGIKYTLIQVQIFKQCFAGF